MFFNKTKICADKVDEEAYDGQITKSTCDTSQMEVDNNRFKEAAYWEILKDEEIES